MLRWLPRSDQPAGQGPRLANTVVMGAWGLSCWSRLAPSAALPLFVQASLDMTEQAKAAQVGVIDFPLPRYQPSSGSVDPLPPSMASVRTLFGRPCLMRLVARCSPLNVPPYSWIAAPTTMANGIGKFFDVNPQAAADISHYEANPLDGLEILFLRAGSAGLTLSVSWYLVHEPQRPWWLPSIQPHLNCGTVWRLRLSRSHK